MRSQSLPKRLSAGNRGLEVWRLVKEKDQKRTPEKRESLCLQAFYFSKDFIVGIGFQSFYKRSYLLKTPILLSLLRTIFLYQPISFH